MKASIILFLTNTDLFHDKIQRSDLATHFPEYEGLFSLANCYGFVVMDHISNQKLEVPCGALACTLSTITGPPGDPEAAKQFLLQLFLSVNPEPLKKHIFSHFTQTVDTKDVRRMLQDICETNLVQHLTDYNLMWPAKYSIFK